MIDREKLMFIHGMAFGSINARKGKTHKADGVLARRVALALGLDADCLLTPESESIRAEISAITKTLSHGVTLQ